MRNPGRVAWNLLLVFVLLGCTGEQERRNQEQDRLRAARARRVQAKLSAEQRRRERERAAAAAMRAPGGEVVLPENDAGMQISLTDEKPGRRRYRFSFPSRLRVVGGLRQRTVYRAMKKRRRAIQQCIRKGWKAKPPLRGTVRLAFAISTLGTITRISVEYGNESHAVTTQCLRAEIQRWRFPKNRKEPTLVGVSAVGRRRFRRRYWRGWRR